MIHTNIIVFQEVLEDILNRTLTKEYLEVVKTVLYGTANKSGSSPVRVLLFM